MNGVTSSIASLMVGAAVTSSAAAAHRPPTIVLVHGAFVDGSGWAGVHRILRTAGYPVVVVQHTTVSLAEDVAATRRAIASCDGEVILVGHSYGGVVITEAGSNPKVSALVYIAAFAPDAGESVSALSANAPKNSGPPILPPNDGFLVLDKAKFAAAFAADVAPEIASFMADSQLPWGVQSLEGKITTPAWKTKPSWFLVPSEDHMIPPESQRGMAARAGAQLREVSGSHAIYVSQPQAVVAWIEEAARKIPAAVTAR
ncbi:MAG TPA: alpha/beta hydrolase [Steroidobacteraceae bacterium]|nr:alpha/beta hydrolase [Steroidobacteraceae bacterium]